jgi:predicted ester cyclase
VRDPCEIRARRGDADQGPLFGIPATGRRLRWDAIDLYRISDGKIIEEWALDDATAILNGVGAYTPPWLA